MLTWPLYSLVFPRRCCLSSPWAEETNMKRTPRSSCSTVRLPSRLWLIDWSPSTRALFTSQSNLAVRALLTLAELKLPITCLTASRRPFARPLSPQLFASQLGWIKSVQWNIISLNQLTFCLSNYRQFPDKDRVCLTPPPQHTHTHTHSLFPLCWQALRSIYSHKS